MNSQQKWRWLRYGERKPFPDWQHIRTTNPIELVFATVRLRTAKTKNCGSRTITLTIAFKLMETAQKNGFRLRGYNLLADVINGVKFVNGIKQTADQKQNAGKSARQVYRWLDGAKCNG